MYVTIAAGDFYLEQDTYQMNINLGSIGDKSPLMAASFLIDLNSLIFGYGVNTNFSVWYELKNFIVNSVILQNSASG